jgi:hypothetical protein
MQKIKNFFTEFISSTFFFVKLAIIVYIIFFCIENQQKVIITMPFIKRSFQVKLFVVILFSISLITTIRLIRSFFTKTIKFMKKI